MAIEVRRFAPRRLERLYIALPMAAAGVAALVAVATAGQAVGPALSSTTTGSLAATISQAVTIDTEGLDATERVTVGGDVDKWAATTNDDGAHFTVAYENNVGDVAQVTLHLLNRSAHDAAAKLVLTVPEGVDVEVTGSSGGKAPHFRKAQMARHMWLMSVDAHAAGDDTGPMGTANRLTVRIRVQDGSKPGFYNIHGVIMPFDG